MPCLSDVRGQPAARRALEVAAAGGHSLLMVGPGAGKSMLAQRLPGLLPPLSRTQALEAAAVAALAGHAQAPAGSRHSGRRIIPCPYRRWWVAAPSPPGEISLAHHGVLFLDELSVRWVSAVCLRQI